MSEHMIVLEEDYHNKNREIARLQRELDNARADVVTLTAQNRELREALEEAQKATLTPTERAAIRVWNYAVGVKEKYGRMPTVSEISLELDLNSTDKVLRILKLLCEQGKMIRIAHGTYAIVYPDDIPPRKALEGAK